MPSVQDARQHRPWALPARRWVMRQVWEDLCFLHHAVPADAVLRQVPAPLELDLFAGQAWISVVPFRMRGVRARGLPPLPCIRASLELNLRTYVRHGGRAGVLFMTLEADNRLFVAGARAAYSLPYHLARMRCRASDGGFEFASHRRSRAGPGPALEVSYGPTGPALPCAPGTLEHFLTERYCLYAVRAGGGILRADIHHPPWPLQLARVRVAVDTLTAAYGLPCPGPPLAQFARRQEVLVWWPEAVA